MNLNDIKDLMDQFDQSSLREFSYKNGTDELQFSKNEARLVSEVAAQAAPAPVLATPSPVVPSSAPAETVVEETSAGRCCREPTCWSGLLGCWSR